MEIPTKLAGENPHITVSMSNSYGDKWKTLRCAICGNVVCEYNNDYLRTISASGEPELGRPGKIVQCNGVLPVYGSDNREAFNMMFELLESLMNSSDIEIIRKKALALAQASQERRNIRCKARYYLG